MKSTFLRASSMSNSWLRLISWTHFGYWVLSFRMNVRRLVLIEIIEILMGGKQISSHLFSLAVHMTYCSLYSTLIPRRVHEILKMYIITYRHMVIFSCRIFIERVFLLKESLFLCFTRISYTYLKTTITVWIFFYKLCCLIFYRKF